MAGKRIRRTTTPAATEVDEAPTVQPMLTCVSGLYGAGREYPSVAAFVAAVEARTGGAPELTQDGDRYLDPKGRVVLVPA